VSRRQGNHRDPVHGGLPHGVELAPLVIEAERFQELHRRERLIALDITAYGVPL
jgi:hypothetical protein